MDLVVAHPFNAAVKEMRAAEFVDRLCEHLQMRQLWGTRLALGRNREGNADTLRELGVSRGYTVHQLSGLVQWQGEPVSSSRIRHSLRAGEMTEVNGCLGRPYLLRGTVIRGDQRGRTIGFPTANIDHWPEQLLPANGVYATFAWLGDKRYRAATNVGVRPTIADAHLSVEAHLLDFDADIYGAELALEFIQHIRMEQKFAGLPALQAQIERDVTAVRTVLP
jgi:riboflavin kinase/FMN adenylyltransferase